MATSGSYVFDPEIADICDEAFERCGVDPASLIFKHTVSARRSLSYLFAGWSTRGVHLWSTVQDEKALISGTDTYTLPTGTIAILDAVLRDPSGIDTPIRPLGREEYLHIPNKALAGITSQFWHERALTHALHIYPVINAAGYKIVFNYMRQLESPGVATNTLGIPSIWQDAIVSGLSAKLAEKYAPEREALLLQKAELAFRLADQTDGESHDTEFEILKYRGR
jgi:hypothetical protein